jgi:hypothetical protein
MVAAKNEGQQQNHNYLVEELSKKEMAQSVQWHKFP